MHRLRRILLGLLLTVGGAALAQDTITPDGSTELPIDDPVEDSSGEPIDEVVVVGEKSMRTLRQAVYRAEENFFDTFSRLNDDNEFDVRCFDEAPTGTRITRHVCRANFLINATSREAEVWRTDGPAIVAAGSSEAQLDRKREELRERLENMVMTNPQLAEALAKYTAAKQNYEHERQEREQARRDR